MKDIKQKESMNNIKELDLSKKELAKDTMKNLPNAIKEIDPRSTQNTKSPYLQEQKLDVDKSRLARKLNPLKRPTPISDIKKIKQTKKEIRDIKEKKQDLSIRGKDYIRDIKLKDASQERIHHTTHKKFILKTDDILKSEDKKLDIKKGIKNLKLVDRLEKTNKNIEKIQEDGYTNIAGNTTSQLIKYPTKKIGRLAVKQGAKLRKKALQGVTQKLMQNTVIHKLALSVTHIGMKVKFMGLIAGLGGFVVFALLILSIILSIIQNSPLGLFFNSENDGQDITLTSIISELQQDFTNSTDDIKHANEPYDSIEIQSDTGFLSPNWQSVLAIYSVDSANMTGNTMPIMINTPQTKAKLKSIFTEMVETSGRITQQAIPNASPPAMQKVLIITCTTKSIEEMTQSKQFSTTQKDYLDEMLSPTYQQYWSKLLGNLSYIGSVEIPPYPGEPMNQGNFKKLMEEAQLHLGKPYIFGANGPNAFDCSSFVCWVFAKSGVKNLPRTTAQEIFNRCTPVSQENLRAGDLVFFTGTYNSGTPVSHIGIYVGNNYMIHAGNPINYANLNDAYWQNHFYAYARLN